MRITALARIDACTRAALVCLGVLAMATGCQDPASATAVGAAGADAAGADSAGDAVSIPADTRRAETVRVDAEPPVDSAPPAEASVSAPDAAPLPPSRPLARCDLAPPILNTARLRIEGTRFRDAADRQVILRGVNAGGRSKMPPFLPFPFAESGFPGQETAPPFALALTEYLDRVVEWGHDTLRLPFTWEAVEPLRGEYDALYLERYRAVISAAGARGLRIIVDFHQDLWARPYCGDGAPLWTLPEPVPALPAAADCKQWFLSYITDPQHVVFPAFDRFWANEDGVRDAYLALWRHMAESTADLDAVIGYEPFNEPHPGTHDETTWGAEILTPFFAEVAGAIRERAPGLPVFFESSGVDATDQTFTLTVPAGGAMVWAPHYYDPRVFLGLPINENFSARGPVGLLARQGSAWSVPVFVGEFGAAADAPGTALYLRKVLDALDAEALNGTVWQYSTAADDWNLEGFSITGPDGVETPAVEEVIRAYPLAIAGELDAFVFDREARAGTLRFAAVPGVSELAAPARLYPSGLIVTVRGEGVCGRYDTASGRLLLRTENTSTVEVEFRPAR